MFMGPVSINILIQWLPSSLVVLKKGLSYIIVHCSKIVTLAPALFFPHGLKKKSDQKVHGGPRGRNSVFLSANDELSTCYPSVDKMLSYASPHSF